VRIHGIHLQGIHAPRGEHRIALDPGYSLVVAAQADESRALLRLVEALLYPTESFGAFNDWIDPELGGSARAGLSFSLGSSAYRVIADFQERRLVLGSYQSAAGGYEKVSTEPAGIAQHLAQAGLPRYDDFRLLCLCQADGETAPAPAPPRPAAPVAVTLERTVPEDERAARLARASQLRQARERLERLEAEEKELAGQQGRGADEPLEGLDDRIESYRERSAQRAQEIAGVEAERRLLLDERSHLAAIPAARASGTWLGVALGAAGALAGTLVHQAFYLAGLVGVIAAIIGLAISRRARRRIGTVEARLAGMRVREASIERRFESETAPLRSLLQTLGVDSMEELAGAGSRQRELAARMETLRAELEAAREAFTPEAAADLGRLEEQLAESAAPNANEITQTLPAAMEPEPSPAVEPEPLRTPEPSDWPERLVCAGERLAGGDAGELRPRLTGVLPIYLRALTGGEYTRAWYGSGDGWSLRRERDGTREPWSETDPELRPKLEVALRLALLEALAEQRRLLLLLGPQPLAGELDPEWIVTLSRALRRLAGALQVVQFTGEAKPWEESASLVQRLSA
jgi:hypothetical protein